MTQLLSSLINVCLRIQTCPESASNPPRAHFQLRKFVNQSKTATLSIGARTFLCLWQVHSRLATSLSNGMQPLHEWNTTNQSQSLVQPIVIHCYNEIIIHFEQRFCLIQSHHLYRQFSFLMDTPYNVVRYFHRMDYNHITARRDSFSNYKEDELKNGKEIACPYFLKLLNNIWTKVSIKFLFIF